MRKILSALLLVLLSAAPALAQSETIPNHSVPISRGAGVRGWHSTGPAATGWPLITQGATTDPAFVQNPTVTGQWTFSLLPALPAQTANTAYLGPSSGVPGVPGFRALVGADLPFPSLTTLGGMEAKTCPASQWLNTLSTLGVPSCAQPAASDLSNGTTGTGLVVLQTSPTITTPSLASPTATTAWTGSFGASSLVKWGATSNYNVLSLNNDTTLTGGVGIFGGAVGDPSALYLSAPAAIHFWTGGDYGQIIGGALRIGGTGHPGSVQMYGSTSGTTTVQPSAAAGTTTLTLPAATDTLVGKATTDTLTNKTFDTAGTGNSLKINGQSINAVSGNTTKVATLSGTTTSGDYAKFDASGNVVDGGTVTSGALVDLTKPPYSAACNGSTNDTTAITSWLAALPTAGPGYVPPGKVCMYNGTLLVGSNTTMYLQGATFKAIAGATNNTTFLIGTGFSTAGSAHVFIYGGTFDSNAANQTANQMIPMYINGSTDVHIYGTTFQNGYGVGGDCLYVGGGVGTAGVSANIYLHGTRYDNCARNGVSIVGVQLMVMDGFNITNVVGNSPQRGIDLEPDAAASDDDSVQIMNGLIYNTTGYAISAGGAAGSSVTNSMAMNVRSLTTAGFAICCSVSNAKGGMRYINVNGAFTGAADSLPGPP